MRLVQKNQKMKKFLLKKTSSQLFLLLFFSLFIILSLSLLPTTNLVLANTLTTHQDTKGGQVMTTKDNNAFFLTTKVATPSNTLEQKNTSQNELSNSNQTSTNSLSSNQSHANFFHITIPIGFATNFSNFVNSILNAVMLIAALLVLYNLITGSLQWITSGGNSGKIEQARNKMFAAVVGIIIVSASYAILILVLNFLGFESIDELIINTTNINGESSIEVLNFDSNSSNQTNSNSSDLKKISD
jgi:hypothetical protein